MDIRTRSVEQTLSRLVSQITTLVNGVGTPKTRGTSWGVSVAVELGRAVERFVAFGEALAENQPQVKVSAMEACGDARRAGAMLAALVCLRDPEGRPQKSPETAVQGGSEMVAGHVSQKNLPQTSSASLTTKVLPADRIDEDTKFSPLGSSTWKRASLSSLSGTVPSTRRDSRTISAHAGRLLLSSVSRMLMLADQTVVSQIETAGKQVQGSLREMEVAKNMKDLVLTFNKYSEAVEEFVSVARYREEDLKDELEAAEMGAARDVLEKSPVVLLTSYKAWLKFPLCETAQVCRAGALDRIRHAVNSIIHLSMYGQQAGNTEAVAVHTSISGSCSQPRMSTAIDNFKGIVERARDGRWSREEWATYSDQLSALLSRAQIMSEAVCVPDVARDSVKGCIGQARHDGNALLQAGEHTMSLKLSECTMEMEVAVVALCRTLDNLKTQLREVATRVASLGAFEQSGSRALARLEAAVVAGDTESVTGLARQLFKHSDGLVEVCNLLLNAAESVAEEVSCAHARDLFDTLTAQLVSACRLRAQYPSSGEVLELTTACHQVWEAARETLPCLLHPTPPIDYERAAVSGLVQDVRWLAAGLEDEGDLWDTSGAAEEAVAERSRAVCNLACALCLQSRGQSKSEAFPELPVLAKAFTKECQRLCETLTALSTKLAGRKEWTRVLADLRRVPGETSENELDGTTESTEAIPSLQAARQALSALLPALRRARTLQDQLEGRLPCPSSPRPARKTQDSVDSATALRHHREQQDHHIRLQAS